MKKSHFALADPNGGYFGSSHPGSCIIKREMLRAIIYLVVNSLGIRPPLSVTYVTFLHAHTPACRHQLTHSVVPCFWYLQDWLAVLLHAYVFALCLSSVHEQQMSIPVSILLEGRIVSFKVLNSQLVEGNKSHLECT